MTLVGTRDGHRLPSTLRLCPHPPINRHCAGNAPAQRPAVQGHVAGAWVTGKLSDLAWVVFALPLLAFLLSLITRGSVSGARAAFLSAYAGLPLLYAAFNTFEPVHYWILRGISLASGGMGRTPLDATDSIVIPLGWAIAVWVWRRPVLGSDELRLRGGLLVAGVAVLASVASLPPEPDYGIQGLGVIRTEDGSAVVTGNWHRSDDGGVSWEKGSGIDPDSVIWDIGSVETPRGIYSIEGQEIVLVGDDGSSEVAYSTEYLAKWETYGRRHSRLLTSMQGYWKYSHGLLSMTSAAAI